MKKRIIALVMVLCMALGLLAACGNSSKTTTAAPAETQAAAETTAQPAADTGEVYTFKMGFSFPEVHPVTERWKAWAEDVKEASNGRIIIEIYPAGTLFTDAEAYEAVTTGVADMGMIIPSYMPGLFPLTELYELPMGFNSAIAITNVMWDLYNEFQPEELSDVKVLCMYGIGPGVLATKKEVNSLEDVKGLQIRATGITGKAIEALGAAPVSVTTSESYEALSRGTVDGYEGGWDAMITWKFVEVVDNFTATSFMYQSPFIGFMNLDKWNSLPEDLQKILAEVSEEYNMVHAEAEEAHTLESIQQIIDSGKNVKVLSEEEQARWIEKIQPVIEKEVAEREAEGVPAQKFYERMLELVEKYNGQTTSYDDVVKGMLEASK